jgi:hypothetical protein
VRAAVEERDRVAVARERGYTIVKKEGTAGRIAEQADPRQ